MFDLHIHTNYSDGLHTPAEVVKMAKANGLKGIAITDHNTFEGIQEGIETAKSLDIEVIPGIEITSCQEEFIGIFIEQNNEKLNLMIKSIHENYDQLFETVYQYLQKNFDFKINNNVVKEFSLSKNRKRITFLCIAEYIKDLSGASDVEEVFSSIFKTRECFSIYDKCFRKFPYAKKVIQTIKKAGGMSILCHPAYNRRFVFHDFAINSYQILKEKLINESLMEMINWGLDGIEKRYPVIDSPESSIRKEMQDRVNSCAQGFNLITSAGSDFHGLQILPLNKLGEYYLNEKEMNRFRRN